LRVLLSLLLWLTLAGPAAAQASSLGFPLHLTDPVKGTVVEVKGGARLTHLVFFATWCPPCLAEMARLQELEATWGRQGYRLVLVMPESMSVERRRLMLAYGASFVLTPREMGMKGSIAKAQELVAETPGAWMPQQFDNPANVDAHVRTTAQEILADFPDGLDALITGVGTGGHITGCARVLKAAWPALRVYAVEPAASPVIAGGKPAPHPIQGIGAGFLPHNLDTAVLDGVIAVEAEAAKEMARRSAREEGLLVGLSSGATLAAIAQKLPELPAGARVLGFNYDTGERYLSLEGFLPAE